MRKERLECCPRKEEEEGPIYVQAPMQHWRGLRVLTGVTQLFELSQYIGLNGNSCHSHLYFVSPTYQYGIPKSNDRHENQAHQIT